MHCPVAKDRPCLREQLIACVLYFTSRVRHLRFMRKRTFKLGPPLEGFFTVTCLCILVYLRVDFDHLGIVQTSVKLNPFKILWGLRCNLLALGRVNCRFCIAIIAVFCTLETFRSEALLKAKCKT